MVKEDAITSHPAIPAPQQERSRLTAERFVTAALNLLKSHTFAELSVAEIAAEAGRSVGAFYQRFGSKDEFLEVLLRAFFERAQAWAAELGKEASASEMLAVNLDGSFELLLANRNLWHAALQRSAAEPGFWARFSGVAQQAGALGLAALERSAGRLLSESERRRVTLARQVFNSMINNQIINGPGPLRLDDPAFLTELRAIALQIAALD
ncbi:TetR/AcrR family transcriptional regulator [Altericroceibacterium xinjiangense]|uniref:TetR/AcrR family transcriptional regulator n=1 Tax=Altericroceibacterium xinjiangense TaxID=762261 RepID=UPI000F7F4797|nr:TetR/AcrR family transcriptional regulator [Altericroceibacterium xinjiangense]